MKCDQLIENIITCCEATDREFKQIDAHNVYIPINPFYELRICSHPHQFDIWGYLEDETGMKVGTQILVMDGKIFKGNNPFKLSLVFQVIHHYEQEMEEAKEMGNVI